jgi:hypothetical protein
MKTTFCIIIMLLVCVAGAHARLGETVDEINHRYGAPVTGGEGKAGKTDGVTIQTNNYYFKNINIAVMFLDGKSAYEQYTPASEDESKVLLEDNAGKYQWRETQNAPLPSQRIPASQISKNWELLNQADVYAVASWSNGILVVTTAELQKIMPDIVKYYAQERKAKEEQMAREKLEGF